MVEEKKASRETKFRHALISVVVMAILMFVCIVAFGSDPQIPLVLGCTVAGIIALVIGYSWDEMLEGMIEGITQSLEAILILLLIGVLVGVWIASGTVPTMIYYGLMVINDKFFLAASMAICGLVAFVIGSWGTVGTIGIALMGIGIALGVDAPLVAGSVISGAYLGEIISPLSDATNLTAAVVGRSVFDVVKRALVPTLVATAVALVAYLVIGLASNSAGDVTSGTGPLLENIAGTFNVSPVTLLPMLVMVVCIAVKVPAIPSMLFGALVGAVVAVFAQGVPVGDLVFIATEGFVSNTGYEMLDSLLTAGGMLSMMNTISIIIIAMAFGGLMKSTGQMEALIRPLVARLHSFGPLNATTSGMCIVSNLILPDQYLGISVPGQMFSDEYDKRAIDRTYLSTGLLGGGAVTSPLIPWNTCGIYCMSILGVGALAYAPYAFFDIAMVVVTVVWGFFVAHKVKAEAPFVAKEAASEASLARDEEQRAFNETIDHIAEQEAASSSAS